MTRRGEENVGLPSFFQDNPWLDILAQRGAELTPDFVVSQASSAPAVNGAMPVIGPEPIASSPSMPPVAGFPKELVVRLEASPELLEAIKELKEAIIMALSVSQRQATIVPIYIPISVAQWFLVCHPKFLAMLRPPQPEELEKLGLTPGRDSTSNVRVEQECRSSCPCDFQSACQAYHT